jgi:hypothetical protein
VRKPLFLAPSRTEGTPEAVVLCLAVTVGPSQSDDTTSTVLAYAAESGARAGTVILALDGAVDVGCLEALCSLQERLRVRGMGLRLAIRPEEPLRHVRKGTASPPVTSLAIHPTLRSALLATYAARPGPGLVTAQVRAALSVSAEPLQVRARLCDDERSMKPEMVRGY